MKTKKTLSFFFFLHYMFMAAFFSSCQNTEVVYGYIPVEEKVQLSWPDSINQPQMDIKVVVIPTGDTITAMVTEAMLHMPGGVMVQYHGDCPWGKNQKVFVKMLKQKDSPYLINWAALRLRELGWRPTK